MKTALEIAQDFNKDVLKGQLNTNGSTVQKLAAINNNFYEFDERGNVVDCRYSNGFESEYNVKGKEIHHIYADGHESWFRYTETGHSMHNKYTTGYENWRDVDLYGKTIHYKNSIGYESWYNTDSKLIHRITPYDYEFWKDDKGNYINKEQFDKLHTLDGKTIELHGIKYKLNKIITEI